MMGIYDRYVCRFFIRMLVICFVVFTSLYVLTDCLNNLDDFLAYAEKLGSLSKVLSSYYGARIFWFFDRTSAMLALVAAAIAVAWMQRSNELVAIMAAGVSRGRIVRPLVFCVITVSLLATLNRELVIPRYRVPLSRNAHNWLGDAARAVQPRYDNETDIFFTGTATYASQQRIDSPTIYLPPALSFFSEKIRAANAYYQAANDKHPAGYLLVDVKSPDDLDQLPTAYLNERPVILTPSDTPWLRPGQCFVVSGVDFEELSGGSAWWMHSSSQQLISALNNRSLAYGADVRVTIHARMVQPLLDVLLFLIGLSVVFTRGGRNVFLAGALCLGVVALFYGLVISCHALGSAYLLNPAFAAWCPILILSPVAYLVAAPIWE